MKILFGESFLPLNKAEEVYKVSIYNKGKKLKKGHAYIVGNYVYPYRGKWKHDDDHLPGIYKKGDNVIVVDEGVTDEYLTDNIITLDSSYITDAITTNKDTFIQPEDLEIINNNSEIYIPTIKETDDFLKYLVKRIIIEKKINLRSYKDKFPNEYALNNMKSGLNRTTKMTVTNFDAWCEILGVKFTITVSDNGTDLLNPLEEDITLDSDEF